MPEAVMTCAWYVCVCVPDININLLFVLDETEAIAATIQLT